MKKEMLKQAVLDYIDEKFKDKVVDKRVQTFFTYSELVDTVFSFTELLNKNIEELEKELSISEHDREHNDYELLEVYKKVEKLEKENAELKETLKTYNGCGDWDNDFHACRVYLQHEELQMYIDQLTKAKEIIRTFLNMPMPNNEEVFADVGMFLTKAEQFLKEIEK